MQVLDIYKKPRRPARSAFIRWVRGRIATRAVATDGSAPDQPEPQAPVDSVMPVAPATGGYVDSSNSPMPDFGLEDSPTVMVVDDESSVRRVCAIALRGEGFRAESEGSSLAALERLKSGERCDVLVLDYFMPELDGLDFLHELDAAGLERPAVLMASAHADGAVATEAMQLGVWDFISKPLTPIDLRRSVQRLLQRPAFAAQGDMRARIMIALTARRWDEAGQLLDEMPDPGETGQLLHGLLKQLRGDEEAAKSHFAKAQWWAGWNQQGSEIWTELARRLDG